MLHRCSLASLLLVALGARGVLAQAPIPAGTQPPPLAAIAANDNRTPAGSLRKGVLALHLEIGKGEWHPGSEQGTPIPVHAFGEAGRALQVPGPMIRVPVGTTIDAAVHNGLSLPAFVHGLASHAAPAAGALTLQPGETRKVRFVADSAGTYYYWAATADVGIDARRRPDSQLQGALIVDPPGAVPQDRVFVISLWQDAVAAPDFVAAINGKQWPHTGRLSYRVGEAAHWRVINASMEQHAMHLHGSYFRVDATGDALHGHALAETDRPMEVTHRLPPGATFALTWNPPHAGRWIFHCHMVAHMTPPDSGPGLESDPVHEHAGSPEPGAGGMGGLVLGITVQGTANAAVRADAPARRLEMVISDAGSARPKYQVEVRESGAADSVRAAAKAADVRLLGPPIVLTRGERTEILVRNRTTEPTAIHWHGIELESYYDGVPGWGGSGSQTTPPIAPGGSFAALMTPPRAGTFIYHTHWHDAAQLTNGLYGPLIVLPPGEALDTATDKVFVFSLGQFPPFGSMLLINGDPQPGLLRLTAARKYRLRLINISPNQVSMRVRLLQGGRPVQWRLIAKDGADVPASQALMQTADQPITVGETYDFELVPDAPGELALEVYLPGPKWRATQAFVVGRAE